MPRAPRINVGDEVYHVINRANNGATIFESPADYKIFENLLEEIVFIRGMRVIAYCIMPNHWHLILYPQIDGEISSCMHWLTTTHSRRRHAMKKTDKGGHVYQGRYKSFIVGTDSYLLQLIRYVERNPVRAGLVNDARDWQYSSLLRRTRANNFLHNTIIELPKNYLEWVNERDENIEKIRNSVNKEIPFGSDKWILETQERFNIKSNSSLI